MQLKQPRRIRCLRLATKAGTTLHDALLHVADCGGRNIFNCYPTQAVLALLFSTLIRTYPKPLAPLT